MRAVPTSDDPGRPPSWQLPNDVAFDEMAAEMAASLRRFVDLWDWREAAVVTRQDTDDVQMVAGSRSSYDRRAEGRTFSPIPSSLEGMYDWDLAIISGDGQDDQDLLTQQCNILVPILASARTLWSRQATARTTLLEAAHDMRTPVAVLGSLAETSGSPGMAATSTHLQMLLEGLWATGEDEDVGGEGFVPLDVLLAQIAWTCQQICPPDVDVSSSSSDDVVGSPVILRRLVENLTVNAVRATDAGQVVLRGGVENGKMWVEVSDMAGGMSDEQVRRLTTPPSPVAQPQMGLGLTIIRRLAGKLGGTINVTPTKRGTTVRVHLPYTRQMDLPVVWASPA